MRNRVDYLFLSIVLVLVLFGLLIFLSASLGLLTRDVGGLSGIAGKQVGIGIGLGGIALLFFSRFSYKKLRPGAPYFFGLTLALTALVFVPHIGFATGGAYRWINLRILMFQPSEILKLGYVLYLAYALSQLKETDSVWSGGMIPFIAATGAVALILLKQPDTGTFMVFFFTGLAMFLCAGMSWKQFGTIVLIALLGLGGLAYARPYVRDRFMTFIHPAHDSLGTSYQIQQALIAVGSGEGTGRGFGQSIQKFTYLPEPIGDSIFAVAAEEFGFIGSLLIILLFIAFTLRGLKIGLKAPDQFSSLLVIGIVIHIVSQSIINISSMLGLIPLTGVPLMFVSQGGTALLIGLCEIGMVLNISRYAKLR